MMRPIPGGASQTLHHALQRARPADVHAHRAELYLKRLTVGGFEKVFEINRNYRNEASARGTTRVHDA